MSNSNYNKIISTINSVSSNYSYVPDPNNLICIDSSNNRIGINTLNPMYSLDASGGTIKADKIYFSTDTYLYVANGALRFHTPSTDRAINMT